MVCLLLVGFTLACKKQEVRVEDRVYTLEDVNIDRTLNPVIRYSDSAVVRVIVTGPLLQSYTGRNEEYKEFTDGIEVEFFDEYGNLSSRLTAKYAIQYDREAKVIVRDSVVWRSVDDQMLESSELIWDERLERVYTNKFSVITTPSDTIFTQYFEANQNFSEITMTSTDGAIIVEDINEQ
jgi:hypothetical protein